MTGPRCRPAGSLAAPIVGADVCHCGAAVRPVPHGEDWAWVDDLGQTFVSNLDAVHAEWDKIRAEMATAGPGVADTPAINRYAVMSAQLVLAWVDWGHPHSPAGSGRSTPSPWCCGQPMQAVPAGWMCRVRRTVVEYDDLLGTVQVFEREAFSRSAASDG